MHTVFGAYRNSAHYKDGAVLVGVTYPYFPGACVPDSHLVTPTDGHAKKSTGDIETRHLKRKVKRKREVQ